MKNTTEKKEDDLLKSCQISEFNTVFDENEIITMKSREKLKLRYVRAKINVLDKIENLLEGRKFIPLNFNRLDLF
jgi:hypothetical protein